ncbi:MAG: type II toxin-antitoxin system RelE/ParE family toxin [Gammaproteobacteria bacterium]|nr:type II toxin-antitoxin system RelE/ParE family toxin [Gammaproteobacteria bacterium]
MKDLILSPEAEQDLVDIWLYIAEDSPANADRYVDKLYKKGLLLAENPKIGTERNELMNELRSFPVDHYVLYYRERAQELEMIRVLHASRDIYSIF